jgi:hypothetical protein
VSEGIHDAESIHHYFYEANVVGQDDSTSRSSAFESHILNQKKLDDDSDFAASVHSYDRVTTLIVEIYEDVVFALMKSFSDKTPNRPLELCEKACLSNSSRSPRSYGSIETCSRNSIHTKEEYDIHAFFYGCMADAEKDAQKQSNDRAKRFMCSNATPNANQADVHTRTADSVKDEEEPALDSPGISLMTFTQL